MPSVSPRTGLEPGEIVDVVELGPLLDLLELFVESNDCRLDHHGYCQQHGWLDEGRCYQARLKDILREHGRLRGDGGTDG